MMAGEERLHSGATTHSYDASEKNRHRHHEHKHRRRQHSDMSAAEDRNRERYSSKSGSRDDRVKDFKTIQIKEEPGVNHRAAHRNYPTNTDSQEGRVRIKKEYSSDNELEENNHPRRSSSKKRRRGEDDDNGRENRVTSGGGREERHDRRERHNDYRRDHHPDRPRHGQHERYGIDRGRPGEREDRSGQVDTHDRNPMKDKEKPNLKVTGKLAEESNTFRGVVIKYNEPAEARKPRTRWRLYGFKGEQELPMLPIHRQSAYLLGRDRIVADIPVDHPSCSKQHAVLQFRMVQYERNDGTTGHRVRPYIIDLESSNGTFLNGQKLDAKRYVELKEKDVVKFGFSSREYVLLHENSKDDELADEDVGVELPE